MFINMTCDNNSNRDITEVYMKLLQHTTYTTTTSTKTTSRDVTTYTGQPIPRRTSTTWVHRGLGIPPTQPTITTKLLTVWYQVSILTWIHRGLGIPPTQPTITTKLLTVWYQV